MGRDQRTSATRIAAIGRRLLDGLSWKERRARARALAHFRSGVALFGRNRLEEAAARFRAAIRLQPRQDAPHRFLGTVLLGQGKPGEAVWAYRRAIRLWPYEASDYISLGRALREHGKLPKSVAAYRKAIRLQPQDPVAHIGLGITLSEQGKRPEAIAEFRQAIQLRPADALAHHWLGIVLYHEGKLDDAIAEFRAAIRLQPARAPCPSWPRIARLCRALSRRPPPEVAISSLAWLGNALSRQGKHNEAIAVFTRAIALDPTSAEAYRRRAGAYRAIGDQAGADRDEHRARGLGQGLR